MNKRFECGAKDCTQFIVCEERNLVLHDWELRAEGLYVCPQHNHLTSDDLLEEQEDV